VHVRMSVYVGADGASSAGAPAGVQGEGGALQPEGHPLHDGHAAPTQLHGLLPALVISLSTHSHHVGLTHFSSLPSSLTKHQAITHHSSHAA